MDHVILCRETESNSRKADRLPTASAAGPLLAIHSQELFLERCALLAGRVEKNQKSLARAAERGAAIVWSGVEARDPDAGRIRLSNNLFDNEGATVFCDSAPGRLEAENCLMVGGCLFDLPQEPKGRDVTLAARQLTLRNAASLCSIRLSEAVRKTQVRAVLDDCVFDLAGRGAALFRLTTTSPVCRRVPAFVVTGGGSVLRPEIPVVAWSNRPSPEPGAPAFDIVVEGLAVGDFLFAGPTGLSASASAVVGQSLEIPRRSDLPPGIVPARLTLVLPSALAQVRAQKQHGSRPVAN